MEWMDPSGGGFRDFMDSAFVNSSRLGDAGAARVGGLVVNSTLALSKASMAAWRVVVVIVGLVDLRAGRSLSRRDCAVAVEARRPCGRVGGARRRRAHHTHTCTHTTGRERKTKTQNKRNITGSSCTSAAPRGTTAAPRLSRRASATRTCSSRSLRDTWPGARERGGYEHRTAVVQGGGASHHRDHTRRDSSAHTARGLVELAARVSGR